MNRRRMMTKRQTTYTWEKWSIGTGLEPISGGGAVTPPETKYQSYPFTAYKSLNSDWQSAAAWCEFSNPVTIANKTQAESAISGYQTFYVPLQTYDGHIYEWFPVSSSVAITNYNVSGSRYVKNTQSVQIKGSTSYGTVESTNRSAYPDNGVQDGYWYVFVL